MSKVNSDNLKTIRKQKGVIQADVANYLGMGRTGYVKIENGVNNVDADTLYKLAEFFGCTVEYLLGKEGYLEMLTRKGQEAFESGEQIPPQSVLIQEALDILANMDEEKQKAAIAQLQALAALKTKG